MIYFTGTGCQFKFWGYYVAASSSLFLLLYCDAVSFKFGLFKLRIQLFWIIAEITDVLSEYQLIICVKTLFSFFGRLFAYSFKFEVRQFESLPWKCLWATVLILPTVTYLIPTILLMTYEIFHIPGFCAWTPIPFCEF